MLQFMARKRQRKKTKMNDNYKIDNLFVVFDKKKYMSRKPLDYDLESEFLSKKYGLTKPNNPHRIHYANELAVVIGSTISTASGIKDDYIRQTIYGDDSVFVQLEKMTGIKVDTIKCLCGYDILYTTPDTYALMCDFIKCAYMLWNVLIKLTSIMETTNVKDESASQNTSEICLYSLTSLLCNT